MKVIEFFAGSRSIASICELYGFEVYTIDWEKYEKIDLCTDIEFLDPQTLPFIPDMAWFSPDCITYSVAAISKHRKNTVPISDYAKKSDRVLLNVLRIIDYFLTKNPDFKYFIENPRGMLRKMPFMQTLPRTTVTYCQYGETRMKPTDIWSNHIYSIDNPNGWKPKPACNNGDKCHEAAPRGSKTGTQALKGSYEKSKIPDKLCTEIICSLF